MYAGSFCSPIDILTPRFASVGSGAVTEACAHALVAPADNNSNAAMTDAMVIAMNFELVIGQSARRKLLKNIGTLPEIVLELYYRI
ncbi:MAG: hypothetical protein ABI348_06155 [Nitrososphaera sp.]|jgi:hypothetical protein